MKIKIIRDTVAQGKPVFVGNEIDVPKEEARQLVAMGKAEIFIEKAEVKRAVAPAPAETATAPAQKKGKA